MSIEVGQYLGQDGVWLKNEKTRLFVQKFGGMSPEFSYNKISEIGKPWVNTHWNPHFRTPFSGKLSEESVEQSAYWGIELMRQAAGTFPCAPTFGPGNDKLLPHGDLANSDWVLEQVNSIDTQYGKADIASWSLQGNYEALQYEKWDILHQSHSSHYMALKVTNTKPYPVPINLAWHTTLGTPFLERGCHIVTNCDLFTTPPTGTEFDHTASLASDSSFTELSQAPNNEGEFNDISVMPGYNGHAEFVTGTSNNQTYLWSVCVNPFIGLAYLTLTPLNILTDQANASFMNYWMHSGGRDFVPWADCAGSTDRTYALGMETSIGASCLGLDWCKDNPSYMKKPSYVLLEKDQTVTFPCVNSLFSLKIKKGNSEQTQQFITEQVEKHIATLDINFTTLKLLLSNNN